MCDDLRCQYLLDTADINWGVHTQNAISTLKARKADLTQKNAGRQLRSEGERVDSAVEVDQNLTFLQETAVHFVRFFYVVFNMDINVHDW